MFQIGGFLLERLDALRVLFGLERLQILFDDCQVGVRPRHVFEIALRVVGLIFEKRAAGECAGPLFELIARRRPSLHQEGVPPHFGVGDQ
jgi:hypothetical protein